MTLIPNQHYLITTDAYFQGPDGNQYDAVWGKVKAVDAETALGINTNARSTNWYVWVGDEDRGVLVAGCQIHYVVACPKKPECKGGNGLLGDFEDIAGDGGTIKREQVSDYALITEAVK